MAEIKLTLETLYDMLRNEKKHEDLQKLPDTFFLDLIYYLNEKQALLQSTQGKDDLFALGEKQKIEYEVRSIQRMIKQLYELREKKIIEIAVNKSRTGSDIIDTSNQLYEEKQLYERLLGVMDTYRRGIVLQLFKGELPIINEQTAVSGKLQVVSDATPLPLATSTALPLTAKGMCKIKFIRAVPSFVWKDLNVYGPFEAGESTEIFPEVAELLIRKGRAEKG